MFERVVGNVSQRAPLSWSRLASVMFDHGTWTFWHIVLSGICRNLLISSSEVNRQSCEEMSFTVTATDFKLAEYCRLRLALYQMDYTFSTPIKYGVILRSLNAPDRIYRERLQKFYINAVMVSDPEMYTELGNFKVSSWRLLSKQETQALLQPTWYKRRRRLDINYPGRAFRNLCAALTTVFVEMTSLLTALSRRRYICSRHVAHDFISSEMYFTIGQLLFFLLMTCDFCEEVSTVHVNK